MRKTKEDALKTRGKIIDAALKVFLDKGYSRTTVEDIVSSLNMTRGAFYWHFKDKDEVFRNIIKMEQEQRIEALNRIRKSGSNERSLLEQILTDIIENFFSNERYRDFIKLRWFRMEQDPENFSLPVTDKMNRSLEDTIHNALRSSFKKGLLKENIDPAEVTSHLIALVNGIYRLYFVGLKNFRNKKHQLNLIRNYINLIYK